MIGGRHQEFQRYLEGIGDLAGIDAEPVVRIDPRHQRQDAKAREGQIKVEIADRLDEFSVEPDLLMGLAERRRLRAFIGWVDAAARKRNLPGMALEFRGTE